MSGVFIPSQRFDIVQSPESKRLVEYSPMRSGCSPWPGGASPSRPCPGLSPQRAPHPGAPGPPQEGLVLQPALRDLAAAEAQLLPAEGGQGGLCEGVGLLPPGQGLRDISITRQGGCYECCLANQRSQTTSQTGNFRDLPYKSSHSLFFEPIGKANMTPDMPRLLPEVGLLRGEP